jgi:septal ring factor EnvC (AmiA/AmiB activator)
VSDSREDRAELEAMQAELRELAKRLEAPASEPLREREAQLQEELAPLRAEVRLQELALAQLAARAEAATQARAALEVSRTAYATRAEVPVVTLFLALGAAVALIGTSSWWMDAPGLPQALGVGLAAAAFVVVWRRRLRAQ